MGRHEDKAEEQRKIESNGFKPGRGIPPEDLGKHRKPDEQDSDDDPGEGEDAAT
jgi:hypothetical protein